MLCGNFCCVEALWFPDGVATVYRNEAHLVFLNSIPPCCFLFRVTAMLNPAFQIFCASLDITYRVKLIGKL